MKFVFKIQNTEPITLEKVLSALTLSFKKVGVFIELFENNSCVHGRIKTHKNWDTMEDIETLISAKFIKEANNIEFENLTPVKREDFKRVIFKLTYELNIANGIQTDVLIMPDEEIKEKEDKVEEIKVKNEPLNKNKFCTKCGNSLVSSDRFCSNCGEIINRIQQEPLIISSPESKTPQQGEQSNRIQQEPLIISSAESKTPQQGEQSNQRQPHSQLLNSENFIIIAILVFGIAMIITLTNVKTSDDGKSSESNCNRISGNYSGTSEMGRTMGSADISINSNCEATLRYSNLGYSATENGLISKNGSCYKFKSTSGGATYYICVDGKQLTLTGNEWICIMTK